MLGALEHTKETERIALPKRSGVIPYRWLDNRLHILLITSRTDGRWIIPKGRLDPNLSPAESAAREAYEEAGVEGRLCLESVGTFVHRRGPDLQEVDVYEFEVERMLEDWPEKPERRREWFQVDAALLRIDSPRLTAMIQALATRLDWANGIAPLQSAATEKASSRPSQPGVPT